MDGLPGTSAFHVKILKNQQKPMIDLFNAWMISHQFGAELYPVITFFILLRLGVKKQVALTKYVQMGLT